MSDTMTKENLEKMLQGLVEESTNRKFAEVKDIIDSRVLEATKNAEASREKIAREAYDNRKEVSGYAKKAASVIKRDRFEGAGLQFCRILRAKIFGQKTGQNYLDVLSQWGDSDLVAHQKALSEGVLASGGALVPDPLAAEMIELLRAKSVVRQMTGVRNIPLTNGTLTLSRQTGAATATYTAEATAVNESSQTLDTLTLSAKKLRAVTAISNDLLRDASIAADEFVRNDLMAIMALRQDLAFIRGDGTVNTPKGIRNWVAAANTNDAAEASPPSTLVEINSDLFTTVRLVAQANVDITTGNWLMHQKVFYHLMSLLNSNGFPVYRDEMSQGRLLGYPVHVTSQIPTNINTDESEVYFVAGSECMIGDAAPAGIDIEMVAGAAYANSSGTVVSGFSRDETAVGATSRHDFVLRHEEGAAVITGCPWGNAS